MDKITEKEPPDVVTSDTPNATEVRPDEAPPHKQYKFRKFRAYNTGTWNGPRRENKELTYRQDNLHRYDALSSQVGLTDLQKRRGRKLMEELDFQQIGQPIDQILFGVCVLVANADVPGGTRYWPDERTKNNDGLFAEVADDLGLDLSEQLSIVQKLKSRTQF